mgnify:CR=1 FL=1
MDKQLLIDAALSGQATLISKRQGVTRLYEVHTLSFDDVIYEVVCYGGSMYEEDADMLEVL